MKPILEWSKKNWVILVCCVVVLASLPTAWIFSSKWNQKIKTNQEKLVNDSMRSVQAMSISYEVPSYEPGQPALTHKHAPNQALIGWTKQQRNTLKQQADAMVKRAREFNQGVSQEATALGRTPHAVFTDGSRPLFPGDGSRETLNKLEDALLGERGYADPYLGLLAFARAGAPIDNQRMAEELASARNRWIEKNATGNRALTSEESEQLAMELRDQRLGLCRGRANELSLFADADIYPTPGAQGFTGRPTKRIMGEILEKDRAWRYFIWQWDLWAMSDVLAAAKRVNTDAQDRPTRVPASVVKRIERLAVRNVDGVQIGAANDNQTGMPDMYADPNAAPAAAPVASPSTIIEPDMSLSITGRKMGPGNGVYDLRKVVLTAVVSSARLNEFLDSITATNFMAVTDLDMTEVDVWGDLRAGYYYGDEHVVRVTLEIETAWLRGWTEPLFPKSLKEKMGIAIPEQPADPAASSGSGA